MNDTDHGPLHGPGDVTPRKQNAGQETAISCPVLFMPFRIFRRGGQSVGRASAPHFDPHYFKGKDNKNHRFLLKTVVFWSCWADSNCRPHPYQGCALPTELQQQRCSPGGELLITACADIIVATRKGREPSTSGVTGRRSNQLNYRAIFKHIENRSLCNSRGRGRRNRTLGTRFWRPLLYLLSYTPIPRVPTRKKWWAFTGSNRGPAGYEPAALTN